MRETVIDIEPQPVITRDNVTVTVDAVVYYYEANYLGRYRIRGGSEKKSTNGN